MQSAKSCVQNVATGVALGIALCTMAHLAFAETIRPTSWWAIAIPTTIVILTTAVLTVRKCEHSGRRDQRNP
jgi:hypothetical protein